MEAVLQEKLKNTTAAYQRFIDDSAKDLKDTEAELERLQLEFGKETILSDTLQREVDINQSDLNVLETQFKKYKSELDDMHWQHDEKLKELELIRQRANEEIKRLTLELSQA